MPPRKKNRVSSASANAGNDPLKVEHKEINMYHERILNSVLLQGYLGYYWIDIAQLRLVCKTWSELILKNLKCVDARCLSIVKGGTPASRPFARIPPQLESLEWLELDYSFGIAKEPVARSVRENDEHTSFWRNLRCLSLRCADLNLDDDDLRLVIGPCSKKLEVLDISRIQPDYNLRCKSNIGGNYISECSNLRFLDLAMLSLIGDEALFQICTSCTQLRALGLAGCKAVTSRGVHIVRENLWKTLEVLDISNLSCLSDDSLSNFASGRLETMSSIDDGNMPSSKGNVLGGSDHDTPHPGWTSLWCLMASFLPNVKQTATIVSLLGMSQVDLAGRPIEGKSALKILECRGFLGDNSNIDEEVYIEAKKRGVACLFKHQDQDDLHVEDESLITHCTIDGELSRVRQAWPPTMYTFRPTQYGKDHFT